MTHKLAIATAAVLGMASQAFAGPMPNALSGLETAKAPVLHQTGSKSRYYKRKYYERDCRPYNGPYGYYGNPFCEGGYSRYGEAGGYEIDLTRYLRRNPYGQYRHGPRY